MRFSWLLGLLLVLGVPSCARAQEPSPSLARSLLVAVPTIPPEDLLALEGSPNRPDKRNHSFYQRYLQPLARQVRDSALPPEEQINLYAFLVIETHQRNGIGYLWGGDMLDLDPDPTSRGGLGYDCSGYVWSVYQAILPGSPFTDARRRLNARDYLPLGQSVLPESMVDEAFGRQILAHARPGDVLIEPRGHISIFGRHPLTREPIVMDNGYEWDPLDNWIAANAGRTFCVRRGI